MKLIGVAAVAVIGGYFILQKAPTIISVAAAEIPKIEMPDVAGAVGAATQQITTVAQTAMEKVYAMGELSVTKITEVSTTGFETVKAAVEKIEIPTIPEITIPELPDIPFIGQIKEFGGKFYEWTGAGWTAFKETVGDAIIDIDALRQRAFDTAGDFFGQVKKIGDDMYEWTKDGWQKIQDAVSDPLGFLGLEKYWSYGVTGAATIGGAFAGSKIGVTAGAAFGPVGMIVGGLAGFLLGQLILGG